MAFIRFIMMSLHIDAGCLNVAELKVFVLGGVAHEGDPRPIDIQSLREASHAASLPIGTIVVASISDERTRSPFLTRLLRGSAPRARKASTHASLPPPPPREVRDASSGPSAPHGRTSYHVADWAPVGGRSRHEPRFSTATKTVCATVRTP